MNLYLVTRQDDIEYDEYASMVVAAENEESATHISPDDYHKWEAGNWYEYYADGTKQLVEYFDAWPADISTLKVVLLGTAVEGTQEGKILASFNAG